MYPVETFTSPYSIFFAGYMQLRSMFSAPLRSAQNQGPPGLVGPVETFTSPYSIFLRGTCSYAPCSPLRFGPPKAKVHWTLWAPSKPLLAHIHFLLTKISDFEISLRLSLLILLGYVCSLIIKLLTFGKCYLYFDQTPLKVYLHRHNCETLFLHL